jgi:hypothetical protein
MARRRNTFAGDATPLRVRALIIVDRDQEDLRQALARMIGTCTMAQIVPDRRYGERRQRDHWHAPERRRGDRRHVPAPAEDPHIRQYVVARPRDRAPRN